MMVKPAVTSGKRIWVSTFTVGAGKTPDVTCQGDRPSGVTTAVALIATPTRAASAVLTPTASYVRPDGTMVGTGAEIAAGTLQSGIWQPAAGTYPKLVWVWTGSARPDAMGTNESTCGNWTDTSMTTPSYRVGIIYEVNGFWQILTPYACDVGAGSILLRADGALTHPHWPRPLG